MSLLRNAQCAHKLLSQKWSRENMLLAHQATLGKVVIIDKLCKAEKKQWTNTILKSQMIIGGFVIVVCMIIGKHQKMKSYLIDGE